MLPNIEPNLHAFVRFESIPCKYLLQNYGNKILFKANVDIFILHPIHLLNILTNKYLKSVVIFTLFEQFNNVFEMSKS